MGVNLEEVVVFEAGVSCMYVGRCACVWVKNGCGSKLCLGERIFWGDGCGSI